MSGNDGDRNFGQVAEYHGAVIGRSEVGILRRLGVRRLDR